MKYKIGLVLPRRHGVPARRVQKLCENLFKYFARHRKIRRAAFKDARAGTDGLTVVFLSKERARALNLKYRGKNYATDILSFEAPAAGRGLGELVLCETVLRKQAKDNKLSFKRELDYMLIHGFLHLLGYDHEKSRREELKMVKLQDKLFQKLSR